MVIDKPKLNMAAIVLAGQRDGEDALAQHAGASCKAFVEIDGMPMLSRVLATLSASPGVATILLSGPDKDKLQDQSEINDLIRSGDISWLPPQSSPSTSAYEALRTLPPEQQVLLTTADHPLLSVEIVNAFCTRATEQDADLVIGFARFSLVQKEFPGLKKTVLRFSDGELCGCNLFVFLTPASREASNFWRRTEARRKNPFRVIGALGWMNVLKYFSGALTLEDALDALSRKLELRVRAVVLPYADAAVDVDSIADYGAVQERFLKRQDISPR